MAAPNSEISEGTTTPNKKGVDNPVVKTDAPVPGGNVETAQNLFPNQTDWQKYTPARVTDASLQTSGAAFTFAGYPYDGSTTSRVADYRKAVEGANKFVGGITGNTDKGDGATDWLFGDSDDAKHKKVTKTAPDGTAVTVDATRTKVTGDAGAAHIEHSVVDGTNIYKSDNYIATDNKGMRTITDVKSGYTVTWDSAHKHGEMQDKDHKTVMTFDSESEFNAKIEHTLTHDRKVSQFTNKEAMDQGIEKYMKARQEGRPGAAGERIFVDAQGDYTIVAKDGIKYDYDKATGKVFATRDGNRVEVQRGSTYQDVAGSTTVTADGQIKLGPTQLDTNACTVDNACTLTTRSDTGTVKISAGQGQSSVANPDVVATTLNDKGAMTNSEQKTQGVFAQADTQGNVSGHTADGANYNFGVSNWTVNEPNGQYTFGNDDGGISTYNPDGTPLINIDPDGGVSELGQPVSTGWDNTTDADGDNDGPAVNSAPATASTAISTFAGTGADISLANTQMDPGKAADLSNRLLNDSAQLYQLADFATQRGLLWAADMLNSRAASALEAANRIQNQERAEHAQAGRRVDQADAIVVPPNTRRREVFGTTSYRTQEEDI